VNSTTHGSGAQAYTRVGVGSEVDRADPHKLILMLYDGAVAAVQQAVAQLGERNVPAKCAAIGKALRIVDEGLKASLDRNAGGPLAFRLFDLYDYMTMRLLQANLRNDAAALDEVARLLSELRTAWQQIEPTSPAAHTGGSTPAAGRSDTVSAGQVARRLAAVA